MADFGMACHQAVSFHPSMLRIPEAEAVFWPGCALLQLDGGILEKTLEVLRRGEPGIRLATGCCGQPTAYLFPEKQGKRADTLARLLQKRGVKRIYTACPNCTVQLRQLAGFEIIPVWGVLAAYLTQRDIRMPAGKFVWHDPCPTKNDPGQLTAARRLLEISGCDFTEPAHTGARTICCGNYHMMEFRDPEKQKKMRARRLAELPADRVILSNCEGCLSAFRGGGRETCHLLELLFGRSKSRGWNNRIQTTLKAPVR
ncbi:MAG: (Fe-S)-binding protein [Oscillospiraceae bacterium]|nr:(Fe-S)-binding protein [Oscillospiraceae bacterium]